MSTPISRKGKKLVSLLNIETEPTDLPILEVDCIYTPVKLSLTRESDPSDLIGNSDSENMKIEERPR